MADSLANENNTCVVCFKNVLYFSIGECDHPVCFECSTRMRVLCQQNECPICRHDLSRVVFTDSIQPYKELRLKSFSDRLFDRQYKIGFCSEEIKDAYNTLLEHCCKICTNTPPFRTFNMLNDHVRKVHERFFCDLCVNHLKIFTSERKCYTRQELAHHRRKGDLDDTSHRGHPLCEFCEERFMDADELYRHLRKEHLYCHLCDADGKNLYYASHSALAHHFRTDHYLCEEGECAGQHLTAVFRSEIDLKGPQACGQDIIAREREVLNEESQDMSIDEKGALDNDIQDRYSGHKATVHGRGLTRGAARQARTLELQFNITPHPVAQRAPRDRERDRERAAAGAGGGAAERAGSPPPPPAAPRIDTRSDEQFPRLSAAQPAPALVLASQPPNRFYKGSEGLKRNDRNFPALDGAPSRPAPPPAPALRPGAPVAAAVLRNSKPSVSIQLHGQPASASSFRLTAAGGQRVSAPPPAPAPAPAPAPQSARARPRPRPQPWDDGDEFPALGGARDDHPSLGAGTVQPPKVTLINSQEMSALKNNNSSSQKKKPQMSSEAFPALSAAPAPAPAPAQWITVAKPKPKPVKLEPPPRAREPALDDAADFPTLPITNAKAKHKKTPQPPPPAPAATTDNAKPTKKEKKKQNNPKRETFTEMNHVNGGADRPWEDAVYLTASVANNNQSTADDRKLKTIEPPPAAGKENGNRGNGDFALAAAEYPPLSGKGGGKKRPPCDGMTFTNSAGQTFPAPVHAYIPPPDFELRNRALVDKFAAALAGPDALENFKVASRAFRDNIVTADEFYHTCAAALGAQLDAVFPELVALLPDIGKQQELVVGRRARLAERLDVCPACGQLCAPRDRAAHRAAHQPPLATR